MAGKQLASSQLNYGDLDEHEPEEAGTFEIAPRVVLERRNSISSVSGEDATKNVFSNFRGFTKSTLQSSPFAFLSNLTDTQNETNEVNTATPSTSVDSNLIFKLSENNPVKPTEANTNNKNEKSAEYYSQLKGLNEGVAEWIKANPLCILTPIFKDYEKYLSEIEEAEKTDKISNEGSIFSTETKTTQSATSLAAFDNLVSKSNESKKASITEETSQNKPPLSDTAKSTFFGSLPSATTSTTGFSFGTGQPFTFSKPESTENSSTNDRDEENEPPKVEFMRVVKDGNIFSKRCKVFVKKDGSFVDDGVGQFLLKPVPGSEKMKLIVRADKNPGNLLPNLQLSESILMQRIRENILKQVSIPPTDAKPPPNPIKVRVITGEDADELLKILEKHKK